MGHNRRFDFEKVWPADKKLPFYLASVTEVTVGGGGEIENKEHWQCLGFLIFWGERGGGCFIGGGRRGEVKVRRINSWDRADSWPVRIHFTCRLRVVDRRSYTSFNRLLMFWPQNSTWALFCLASTSLGSTSFFFDALTWPLKSNALTPFTLVSCKIFRKIHDTIYMYTCKAEHSDTNILKKITKNPTKTEFESTEYVFYWPPYLRILVYHPAYSGDKVGHHVQNHIHLEWKPSLNVISYIIVLGN